MAQSSDRKRKLTAMMLPLRLLPDQDLKLELTKLAENNKLSAAFVVSGIGSLSRLKLRMANSQAIIEKNEAFEILSLQGTLSDQGVHLHISVSDSKGHLLGGHVVPGCIINTTAEILVVSCEDYDFKREVDATTGYMELKIYKKS
jgi:predicted DNA-binding protein with PD1-like motif